MRPGRDDTAERVERTSLRYVKERHLLGERLREARRSCGWTLDVTAERSGLDLKHLQKIEAGAVNVTLLSLVRLATGFRTDVRTLFSPHFPEIARRRLQPPKGTPRQKTSPPKKSPVRKKESRP